MEQDAQAERSVKGIFFVWAGSGAKNFSNSRECERLKES